MLMKTGTLRHISLITAIAVLFFTAIAISTPMRSSAELKAEKGFILIESKVGEEIVHGIKWRVFSIGSRGDNGFVLNETFADSGVKLDDMSAEAVKADAETLCDYIFANQIQPDFEEASDENGIAEVYAQNAGIYLIYSNEATIDKYTYRSSPAIVELKKSEGSVVLPKIEKEKTEDDESGPDDSSHDTHDSESSNDSSDSDSDVSDRDTPDSDSSANDSSSADSSSSDGSTSSTSDSDSSRGTRSGTDNNSGNKTQGGGSSEKLPQTGQLWWPVPVLSVSGLVLVALGMRVSMKKDGKDD